MNAVWTHSCIATAVLLATVACGARQGPVVEEGDRLEPRRLYPLAQDNVWSYNVYNVPPEDGDPALQVLRVTAAAGNGYEVASWGGTAIRYELQPEGIWMPLHEAWLLKAPIEEGASWPTRSERIARVVDVHASAAGENETYEDCVRVEETGEGITIGTIYCPDIGPVEVEQRFQAEISGREIHQVGKLLAASLGGAGAPEPPPVETEVETIEDALGDTE